MKKIALVLASVIAALSFVATPVFADNPCDYYTGDDKDLICSNHNENDAMVKVGNILNWVFSIIGIIAVIVVIIGGVFYTTSQGDPAKTARAKSTILYAVIGLIIVLLSFAIVNFILGSIK